MRRPGAELGPDSCKLRLHYTSLTPLRSEGLSRWFSSHCLPRFLRLVSPNSCYDRWKDLLRDNRQLLPPAQSSPAQRVQLEIRRLKIRLSRLSYCSGCQPVALRGRVVHLVLNRHRGVKLHLEHCVWARVAVPARRHGEQCHVEPWAAAARDAPRATQLRVLRRHVANHLLESSGLAGEPRQQLCWAQGRGEGGSSGSRTSWERDGMEIAAAAVATLVYHSCTSLRFAGSLVSSSTRCRGCGQQHQATHTTAIPTVASS